MYQARAWGSIARLAPCDLFAAPRVCQARWVKVRSEPTELARGRSVPAALGSLRGAGWFVWVTACGATPSPVAEPTVASRPVPPEQVEATRGAEVVGTAPTSIEAPPGPVPEPPPSFDGPCPPGMALVEGGRVGKAQHKRWTTQFYREYGARSVPDEIAPFCLDIHEATEADFLRCGQACQEKLPGAAPACVKDGDCGPVPLTGLYSHENYLGFCGMFGKRPVALAEWLWAAGGGAEDRKYPWGNARPTVKLLNACDYRCAEALEADCESARCDWRAFADVRGEDGHEGKAPVGSFPAGAGRWGQLDLAGNVYELAVREDGRLLWCGGAFSASQLLPLHNQRVCDTGVPGGTDGIRCARDVAAIDRP